MGYLDAIDLLAWAPMMGIQKVLLSIVNSERKLLFLYVITQYHTYINWVFFVVFYRNGPLNTLKIYLWFVLNIHLRHRCRSALTVILVSTISKYTIGKKCCLVSLPPVRYLNNAMHCITIQCRCKLTLIENAFVQYATYCLLLDLCK